MDFLNYFLMIYFVIGMLFTVSMYFFWYHCFWFDIKLFGSRYYYLPQLFSGRLLLLYFSCDNQLL